MSWDQFIHDYTEAVSPAYTKDEESLRDHILGLWEEKERSDLQVAPYETKTGLLAVFVFDIITGKTSFNSLI